MKQSMTRQNFRKITNNIRNFRPNTVATLIALANFGVTAFKFLNSLITVGATPFENLNRGQMRQMSWLFAMYRC